MTTINPYLLIITANVNGLNSPITRQKWLNVLKKKSQEPTICLPETDFRFKDTHTYNEGMEKDILVKW